LVRIADPEVVVAGICRWPEPSRVSLLPVAMDPNAAELL
jgi:hypothetical protein